MDKAYIVANEQQEREVLEKLEREGMLWRGGDQPTDYIPTKYSIIRFPYVIFTGNRIAFNTLSRLEDEEIVYDGRKEEKMSEKYVVSQEFMNELEEWKSNLVSYDEHSYFIDGYVIEGLPVVVNAWWGDEVPDEENNNRLIAIIRWVNGEDVFEVEKPKKWVVRSKGTNIAGDYVYVAINDFNFTMNTHHLNFATKFDTKEEAQEWANAHQEVFEVEE